MKSYLLWLVVSNFIIFVGLVLFVQDFFPYKTVRSGFSSVEDYIVDGKNQLPTARYKKFVFMVVDALRSDFVYDEGRMPFVQSLIDNGFSYPLTAYSSPPTVTLPRLKGLTTGTNPNFLDAVLNIAEDNANASLTNQDSWVAQMIRSNKSIVFYGDNTWLKLFGDESFLRFDGTSSFYVNDYTEVDVNVTRHISSELAAKDWDAMILHYLGLDHIGHMDGPNSPLMKGKLLEMDNVVRTIYNRLTTDEFLILCGDHGMNNIGNHGGSSKGETSAALVVLSKSFNHKYKKKPKVDTDFEYYDHMIQPDIVTTITLLMGLPIPRNSIGIIPKPFWELWNDSEQKRIKQILFAHIHNLKLPSFGSSDHIFENDDFVQSLMERQNMLMSTLSDINMFAIYRSIIIMIMGLSLICIILYNYFDFGSFFDSHFKYLAFIGLILYSVSMASSSYVEEEQNFWYWMGSMALFIRFYTW